MNRLAVIVVVLVAAAALLRMCTFVVDQRRDAIVFAFGQIHRVVHDPGLHFKLPPPFQNVDTVDKRILTIDAAQADRVQTSEKKNLLVDSFVKWRISDARNFWISFQGSERAAEDRISTLVRDALNQAVNKRTVNEITSRERDKAMEEIRVAVQERVRDLGVTIVDVRLKRVDLLPEISESVYHRMEAERKRVAAEQRAIGAAEYEKIRADADRQSEVLIAAAYRDAQQVVGAGDAKAAAIYAQAFGQSPEFFAFYRSLDAYRKSFRSRSDLIVVDPSSAFFRYMKDPGAARPAR
ncbi:MAG TPA: protease modulator HflC [Burkholderiaceae bacterium]|nr:protease modulator HflC [Burkholderiaceae bacterium]